MLFPTPPALETSDTTAGLDLSVPLGRDINTSARSLRFEMMSKNSCGSALEETQSAPPVRTRVLYSLAEISSLISIEEDAIAIARGDASLSLAVVDLSKEIKKDVTQSVRLARDVLKYASILGILIRPGMIALSLRSIVFGPRSVHLSIQEVHWHDDGHYPVRMLARPTKGLRP